MARTVHLAIKDSLTYRPSSQGWAPGVLLSCCFMCVCVLYGGFGVCECVYVFCMGFWGFVIVVGGCGCGGGGGFIFFSLSMAGMLMYYNFMQ